MKRALKILPIVLGVLIIVYFVFRAFVPATNIAETSPAHADAELRTHYYQGTLEEVHKAINEAIPAITTKTWGGNWKVVEKGAEEQTDKQRVVKAEIPVAFFTDDMKITLRADGGRVAVDVYSASRVGKSDLGENRKHIIQLFEKLDEKLAAK